MEQAISDSAQSRMNALAARLAIGATAAAFALLVSLHVLSPEFSPAWRMISEYANGQYSWVLSLMFAAYGLSMLALAFAIRSELRTKRGKAGLVLLTLSGIGAASAAIFDLNQEALHELAGALGYFGLPVPAMLITTSLCRVQPWSAARKPLLLTANLTWISVVLWIGTFVLMIATVIHALGGLSTTPPADLPPGVIGLVGWANRLAVLSAWAWVVTVAWQVIKLQRIAQVTSRPNRLAPEMRSASL